ncbi:MAG: tRNA (adenosine(37)-N6)-threonylcarbamoyltransferase complex transferase subunit TsaD [Myxococcaceae bacterium]|nr:tRNA (adenosine(37)-N6)-threonylcarbamoyltransferase complex transferase subunit TsaD [Myxococcaceae bacterium]
MEPKALLAIESSCDDCAVAVLNGQGEILSDLVHSQIEPHAPFGGIVPEIASRQHLFKIAELVRESFVRAGQAPRDIEAVAVTNQPGLIGSLLVGAQFAKGFAQALDIPILGIHHIEGHLLAGWGEPNFPQPPFLGLVASGGHSSLYHVDADYEIRLLGQTLDDAAGEAFDKIGRLLGLPYPAGKEIDGLAKKGDPNRFVFPTAFKHQDTLNYSFSGLKTAARRMIERSQYHEQDRADFCASLQKNIAEALVAKIRLAVSKTGVRNVVAGGGVSANSALRSELIALGASDHLPIYLPPTHRCVDNAVMIARAALRRFKSGERHRLDFPVEASSNWC